jgi:hypothetical protein
VLERFLLPCNAAGVANYPRCRCDKDYIYYKTTSLQNNGTKCGQCADSSGCQDCTGDVNKWGTCIAVAATVAHAHGIQAHRGSAPAVVQHLGALIPQGLVRSLVPHGSACG